MASARFEITTEIAASISPRPTASMIACRLLPRPEIRTAMRATGGRESFSLSTGGRESFENIDRRLGRFFWPRHVCATAAQAGQSFAIGIRLCQGDDVPEWRESRIT